MPGIKGMKTKKNHEDSPRFAEYYQKEHPEWTIEQCEEKAKWFKRSCNYQCIEYYEKNYPNLSHDEHLKLKEQIHIQKKQNNPLNLEYYIKHYPDLSNDKQIEMWHKYSKENCYQSEEYYIKRGASKEEAKELKRKKLEIVTPKIVAKISGQNNGMSSTNRTEQQRKESSPFSKEFYIARGLSEEDRKKFNENVAKNRSYNTRLEYYMNKDMSEEEARKALYDRQATFSYEKCIQKYGELEGNKIFSKRQQKWLQSLYNNFQSNGDGRSKQSIFAKDIIKECCKKLKISIPKKEKYIYWKQTHQAFAYDFMYKNKIIEFQGDYWHCNPNLYDKDFYNKVKQKTAQEIWNYDNVKKECAEYYGYDILYIWEYDYYQNREEVINKCIEFLNS